MKLCKEQHCKRCRDSPVCPISGTVKASTAEEKKKWRQSGSEAGYVLAHCSARGQQLRRRMVLLLMIVEMGGLSCSLTCKWGVTLANSESRSEVERQRILAFTVFASCCRLPYCHSYIDIATDWSSYAMGEVTLHHNLHIQFF